ncbi:PREDICTED: microtubule-associated protein 70-5-like [Nicotiana attenuata]|uniref:Microtubule-associated protein 70-5 n=1 Tax=Nicotiana attenuata TaxID=49451 RepID=A0A1J6ILL4_NICAT|nr:PREDICTED: microtubule-associated protein 70-5-like [Nicotiana attenuata]OIT05742.1 microtubule-associated protein 70-5 [Nicotiana attenuata]
MSGIYELGIEEYFLAHPDPVILEINNLQNQLKEKDRELGAAQSEIKALKATEVLKDKALEELGNEFQRLEGKLKISETLVEQKNLDIKRLANEKKEALAAQYAAEATLRRVYADQKDDDSPPLESIIAPLEAEIKMYKNEIAALQEDKRALDRHTKSKEAALLQAEMILKSALERALIVEEIQNQNFELRRQIEIFQEETKILDKTNRQKILEVEKLSQTIVELEEAILAGGAAANRLRDYKRQISELQEEKRTLERELARVKVSANRVATVVANEWKDENDKVMPVKQWLEERRLLQAEMQRLKDKLSISERTAKAEAQLKDKLKLRLKTLEEGLKQAFNVSVNPNRNHGSTKIQKTKHFFGVLSNNTGVKKRSTSQPRVSTISRITKQENTDQRSDDASGEMKQVISLKKKTLWDSRDKNIDSVGKENTEMNSKEITQSQKVKNPGDDEEENKTSRSMESDSDDIVSGFLYDRLQKEVISLRKFCETKESALNTKDEEIKMLTKKIETLSKAIEVEARKRKVKQQGQ